MLRLAALIALLPAFAHASDCADFGGETVFHCRIEEHPRDR